MGNMLACSNEVRFLLCSPKLERKDPRAMKSYTYELVRDAYLHGVMKGEQWRENDCRTLSFV